MRLLTVFLFVLFTMASPMAANPPAPLAGDLPVQVVLPDEDFVYDDHAGRDPFWPLVTAGGAIVTYDTNFSVSEMILEGIVTDGDGGVAIINGVVVGQGQPIGPYMVQRVEQDKVSLVKDGQESILRLKKEE